jgi:hypothetical protein
MAGTSSVMTGSERFSLSKFCSKNFCEAALVKFLFCSKYLSVQALAAGIATQRGSLIDSPKPELDSKSSRPRGKDQPNSWRPPGISKNKPEAIGRSGAQAASPSANRQ